MERIERKYFRVPRQTKYGTAGGGEEGGGGQQLPQSLRKTP